MPGSQVDLELNNAKSSIDGVLTNLALIQRDDGGAEERGLSTEEIGTDPAVDSGVRIRALLAAGLLFGVPVPIGGGTALSF